MIKLVTFKLLAKVFLQVKVFEAQYIKQIKIEVNPVHSYSSLPLSFL